MQINPNVRDCAPAPIAQAWTWVSDRPTNAAPVIDACQAVPTEPPPAFHSEAVASAIVDGSAMNYTPIAGLDPLRAALAADLSERYGASIAATDAIITAGCNQAFCTAIDAVAGAGDNVVLPVPYYFNHDMWLGIRGIEPRHLTPDDAMIPSPDAAQRLIDDRTRAILLVTPNNPTGAVYPAATIRAFYELATSRGIALILDETYRDYAPLNAAPHHLFSEPDWRDTVMHLYSFSKAYSLTGYRVGALVCGGDTHAAAIKIQDCAQICAPHIGQLAALHALENLQPWKRAQTAQMADRANAFRHAFADADLGFQLASTGAYFAYVRHPFDDPGVEVAERLAREYGVVSLPGSYFGPGQERYLRLAMSNVTETLLPDLVSRLKAAEWDLAGR